MDSPIEICDDDDGNKSLLNINRLWSSKIDVYQQEMQELGVALLPSNDYFTEENNSSHKLRKKAELLTTNEVYSDFAQEEDQEFKTTKKAKNLNSDTFLYKKNTRSQTQHKGGPDLFLRMSDEIILYIFSYLNHRTLNVVSQVSKRFRCLARDESLWPRLEVSGIVKTDTIGYILSLGVRVLKLTGSSFDTPILSHGLSMKLANLEANVEYLDLSEAVIKPNDLQILCSKLYHVKKLSLEGCDLNTKVLKEISKNKCLDTLNLAMCTGINAKGIRHVVINCSRLEFLNLSWTGMDSTAIEELVANINLELKEINLSGHQTTVKDKDVITLIKRCRNLRELDLSDCLEISQAIISAIIENLFNLRSLSISRCFKINPVTLTALSSLPRFEKLNAFRQITKSNIYLVESKLPKVLINKEYFSTVARPCVGIRRTSIWQIRCRE